MMHRFPFARRSYTASRSPTPPLHSLMILSSGSCVVRQTRRTQAYRNRKSGLVGDFIPNVWLTSVWSLKDIVARLLGPADFKVACLRVDVGLRETYKQTPNKSVLLIDKSGLRFGERIIEIGRHCLKEIGRYDLALVAFPVPRALLRLSPACASVGASQIACLLVCLLFVVLACLLFPFSLSPNKQQPHCDLSKNSFVFGSVFSVESTQALMMNQTPQSRFLGILEPRATGWRTAICSLQTAFDLVESRLDCPASSHGKPATNPHI